MDQTQIITAFVTLFVVMDPIGLVPLFLALTQGMSAKARLAIGMRACIIAAGMLLVFGVAGEAILSAVGISMPAFRIAGGILLFLTALDMLFERRTQRRENKTTEPEHDPSVFPLATPLIAGPGTIASMILLTGQMGGDWSATGVVIGLMLVLVVITYLFFMVATPLEKVLGRTGTLVVTRLLGMLLAALSVQFVIDGVRQIVMV